jgi:acetylornithine/succinyldiaminopimelate/putrescine aminotransferase
VETGEPARGHLIARRQSYHGNTLGALSASGNAWRRAQFAPILLPFSHIAPCYDHRLREDGESPEAYGLRAANELEAEILRVGPETVMAFIAEPVVGATAGAVPPAPGYFARIRQICDRYGVLLILDEVMCGMGRTGTLFACEQDGIAPDIACIAKGLGAGYQPIGAMLCSAAIYRAIENGSGRFQHGHTYLGHPAAAAGGLAAVSAILDRGLIARVNAKGAVLADALTARFDQHPNVGDIRGRGLFMGLEPVADRTAKTPFDPTRKLAATIKAAAFEAGLICYPMSGTIDGAKGITPCSRPRSSSRMTRSTNWSTSSAAALTQASPRPPDRPAPRSMAAASMARLGPSSATKRPSGADRPWSRRAARAPSPSRRAASHAMGAGAARPPQALGVTTRIRPSCAALATSTPSRVKTRPRLNPRAPPAQGLSMEYKSHSSARKSPWIHSA